MPEINLMPFRPEDQAAVKQLVLAGLGEHWGKIDPTKNPDLNDIAVTYAAADFQVARSDGRIVGCGALVPRGDQIAEIVRMSVAADMRRQGIAHYILNRLIEIARERGCKQVTLETTATWAGVIEFYLRCGFRITHHKDGDVYFALDLL
jgi:N-acetylglutamate synthase-like GNAT family acetyltransferase